MKINEDILSLKKMNADIEKQNAEACIIEINRMSQG